MKNKVCSHCKNEIFTNSVNADELYVICVDAEVCDYGLVEDEYDYHFYVRCRDCNSLIKITTEEAKEIFNNCGYDCEYYWRNQLKLNVLESAWKGDYPNNLKLIDLDYHSGFNPNDIFKLNVEINVSDDIISKLDDARECLNDILKILNNNKADKKCQNAYNQLYHILYDFDAFECNVKEIVEENLKNRVEKIDTKEIVENKWYWVSKGE